MPVPAHADDAVDDDLESDTLSFVIRIWIEDADRGLGGAAWRGHITHVPSGDRKHIAHLDDIVQVVGSHLASRGVWIQGKREGP